MRRLLVILCFPPLLAVAQTQPSERDLALSKEYLDKGKSYLLDRHYLKALKNFEKAAEYHPQSGEALRSLAVCHTLLGRHEEASFWYDQILLFNPEYSRLLYFQAAEAHAMSGNYPRAIELYRAFEDLQQYPSTRFGIYGELEAPEESQRLEEAPARILDCRIARDSVQFSQVGAVENLGTSINTPADEYFPWLSNDHSLLLFTAREDKFSDEDLYQSQWADSAWQPAHILPASFKSTNNEGMCTFVRSGRTLYFTACNRQDVQGTCDIWEAVFEGGTAKKPRPLQGDANSDQWESQASISCDGNLLFFSSNREGGQGGTDIWMCKKEPDGAWGPAINLGPEINTAKDEEAPFITNDGKTLYFSSNGHRGLGEQDLFFSKKQDDGFWSPAANLGAPVNSSYRELGFFLSADGKTGFFASNRDGGAGGMDIYSFVLPEELFSDPITFTSGTVLDSFTLEPIQTMVFTPGRGPVFTDEAGRFFLCLRADSLFETTVLQQDYKAFYRQHIIPEWDNRQPYELTILLSPVHPPLPEEVVQVSRKNLPLREHNHAVYFDFNKSDLNPEASRQLESFIQDALSGQNIRQVSVVGYSDQIGSDRYNMALSESRAKTVALYLKQRGIVVHEIYIEGSGVMRANVPEEEKRKVVIQVKIGD